MAEDSRIDCHAFVSCQVFDQELNALEIETLQKETIKSCKSLETYTMQMQQKYEIKLKSTSYKSISLAF